MQCQHRFKVQGVGRQLTVNIALALICLRNEEVGYVTTNMVLITGSIATEDFLQTEKGQLLGYVKNG